MYIYELEYQNKITIEISPKLVTKNIDKLSLDTEILTASKSIACALIPLITSNGKIINFDSEKININVFCTVDDKPLVWKNCEIKTITYGGNKYHAILCNSHGKINNKRNFFRVQIDEEGHANIGKSTINVFVKDMSVSGFCFSIDKKDDCDISKVKLSFEDSSLKININVAGEVVRKEEIDEKVIYGCLMPQNNNIEKYLVMKQRKQKC